MTQEELRVLDGEIAEKIMGWTDVHLDAGGSWVGKKPGKKTEDIVYYYTQVLICAWEVADKMDLLVKGCLYRQQNAVQDWTYEEFGGPGMLFIWADTAPLALCKAALKMKKRIGT